MCTHGDSHRGQGPTATRNVFHKGDRRSVRYVRVVTLLRPTSPVKAFSKVYNFYNNNYIAARLFVMDADTSNDDAKAIISIFSENLKQMQLQFSALIQETNTFKGSVKPKTPVLFDNEITHIASSWFSTSDCSDFESLSQQIKNLPKRRKERKEKNKTKF